MRRKVTELVRVSSVTNDKNDLNYFEDYYEERRKEIEVKEANSTDRYLRC